jgi:hypothetical protein
MAVEQKHASESERTVEAACAIASEKEQCCTLVLETRELAKKLTRPELKRMAAKFAKNDQACVSTSGKPFSMLHPDTWSQCFLDFFYGDAVPNMPQRGQRGCKGNNTVHVPMEELFVWLQDREELEYQLPSDAVPYKARATSRFDTSEFTAIFGSALRYSRILRGVGAVFKRQGYEADMKQIAQANTTDCMEALCGGASKNVRQRGIDQLAYAADVPENLRKALRQVLWATTNVPFTDGYRRNLRHEGHNLNAVHGPLKIFMTANFADVYSPVMLSMLLANGDGNPVAEPIEVPWPPDLSKQCPDMCTLQEMHRLVAQSPRTQAKFWLLMDGLVDRYLLGIARSFVGTECTISANFRNFEDDLCSSGEPGLAGFAENELAPCEAQARGFTHAHRKVYGVPRALGSEVFRQLQAFSAEKPEDSEATTPTFHKFVAEVAQSLVQCASTLQYEAARLPAKQMKQEVPAEKFTLRQQELSRLDGGSEIDGTQRETLEPTPDEPLGHIVAEEHRATLENRPVRNAYREVPLTGCHNSMLPLYRQPHFAFSEFPVLDEFGCHQDAPEGSAVLQSLPGPWPWQVSENGQVIEAIASDGGVVNAAIVEQDAQRFALSFARDTRALHCHNHDHNCSFTCIKYLKQKAKKAAETGLNSVMNIVCRFFFFVTLVFKVLEDGIERVRQVRRRGKGLVLQAFVASSNERNELGRVQVERHTPFRGATSDIGQCAARCNFDFQFMPRAPVFSDEQGLGETSDSAAKSVDDTGPDAKKTNARQKGTLSYHKAEAFYRIRRRLPDNAAMRQAAHSMLAMWQAAHNTDFYITKYGTKAFEQLQNLIVQFAFGLRRLESEEEREAADAGEAAVLENLQAYKRRARRVTLRLAMAANRATWCSCCEMALFIRTGAHVRKTYNARPIYLSRLAYLSHTCQRLLRHGDKFQLEAADEGTTDLSTLSFTLRPEAPNQEAETSLTASGAFVIAAPPGPALPSV